MKSAITISLVEEARGGPFVFSDDLSRAIGKAAKLGFDAVEIFPPSASALNRDDLSGLLCDHGIKLAAIGTGAGWLRHRLSLADPDPSIRRNAAEFICEIVEIAASLGASAIIGSMQGRWGGDVSREQARDYLLEGLATCSGVAKAHGVALLYEPLNRYETNQACTLGQAASLLEGLGENHPVRLLADLFHMGIEESDVAGAIRAQGRMIGHVHFVDSNRRPPGYGHTDFGPIISALREIGYTGYLSAEALPYPDADAAALKTIRAIQYLTDRLPG